MPNLDVLVDGGSASSTDATVTGTLIPDDTFELLTLMGALI